MPNILMLLIVFVVSYLIGSIPTAYLIGKLNHVNIFEMGSGNMGANNVTRSLGFKWGVLTWFLDSLKGVVAIVIGRLLMFNDWIGASVISSIAVVVGHNWSFLATLITGKLRGGKGAATAAGTYIMMAPAQVIILTMAAWAAIVLLTRYVSLGVLVAVAIGTTWMLVLINQPNTTIPHEYVYYALGVATMVYVRHWKNIQSLLAGRERRLGDRV
jgi:acyl phosphate:glycerol-3-phosphate acyltransferase